MSSLPTVSKILTQTMAELESRPDMDPAEVERLRLLTLRMLIEADAAEEKRPDGPVTEAA